MEVITVGCTISHNSHFLQYGDKTYTKMALPPR
jgi:hypothetical protein